MENQENIQYLEQLRSEVAEFKNRIEQQEIVNQTLLKHAMTAQVSWVKNYNFWVSIIGLCFLPILIAVMRLSGISWGPIIFITVMVIGESIFNFCSMRTIAKRKLMADDVLTASQRLLTYKRREQWQMIIELPLIVLWFAWVYFDLSSNSQIDSFYTKLAETALIGGILGLIFSIFVFVRSMSALNRAAHMIE